MAKKSSRIPLRDFDNVSIDDMERAQRELAKQIESLLVVGESLVRKPRELSALEQQRLLQLVLTNAASTDILLQIKLSELQNRPGILE
jgi:hypothetical protein